MYNHYHGDPYWTHAHYSSTCRGCGKVIRKNGDIFYYPRTKSVYCNAPGCGQTEDRRFRTLAQDEFLGSVGSEY